MSNDGEAAVRILQVLNHMDRGGIEAVVLNYYRHMQYDKVQFDFAVSQDSQIPARKEIEGLGGRIYLLPSVSSVKQYIRELEHVIKSGGYRIVHFHMNTLSVFGLYAAWRAGASVRICHNHTTAHNKEGMRTLAKYALRPWSRLLATDYFACGAYAGRWMYGEKRCEKNQVHIMQNAIDVEQFRYNPILRLSVRRKLNLGNRLVIGHVGRFMYQKNHMFLLEILKQVKKEIPDAVLLLVGEGELEEKVRRKTKELNLEQNVIFYGPSNDVSALYQAMDVFCLPSFYEGLPVVAVEAQANGLPVIVSDNVTKEAACTERVRFLSLDQGAGVWAQQILNADKMESRRERGFLQVEEAGFSIEKEARRLQEYYLER